MATAGGMASSCLSERVPATATILGTPSYMAPEQAAGQTALVGPAADIYALGAILYDCLTGRRAFDGTSVMEVLVRVREREPLAPRKVRPSVPRDLEVICLKCLRKEPGQRYQSARALAEELRRFREGEPILARPLGRLGQAWAWARRRPALAATYLLTAVALSLGAGAAGAIWLWRDAEAARGRAETLQGQAEEARKGEAAANETLDQVLYLQRVQLAHREWLTGNVGRCLQSLAACPEGRRGWEWHYVRRLPEALLRLGKIGQGRGGPGGDVVALSPDGRLVAAGNVLTGLRVWDAQSGRELAALERTAVPTGPDGSYALTSTQATRLVFSPDGARLIGGTAPCPLGEWKTTTGKLLPQRLRAPFADSCLAISPDGKHLALGASGTLFPITWMAVVPVGADGPARKLAGHTAPVCAIAYSPDGVRLASGDESGGVILWGQHDKPFITLRRLPTRVADVAFSPRGQRLAAAADGGLVKVWQAADGGELFVVSGRGVEAARVTFLTEDRLAVGMNNGEIAIWDIGARREAFVLRGHAGLRPRINGLAASRDGRRLVCIAGDGAINIWDATQGTEHRQQKLWENFFALYVLQPGGDRALALVTGGFTELWDLAVPRRLWRRKCELGLPFATISPDGSRIALTGNDLSVRVLDAEGNELRPLRDHHAQPQATAFSADGRYLLSGAGANERDGDVRLWDVGTGGPGVLLPGVGPMVTAVALSPDGQQAVAVDDASVVHAWDLTTQQEAWKVRAGGRCYRCLAYSPDGKLLAIGTPDRVELLDARDGRAVRSVEHDGGPTQSVAFSPDGRRLVAGTSRVTLWDVASGQPALTLAGPPMVTFSADGRRLVGCGPEGQAWQWDASPLPPAKN